LKHYVGEVKNSDRFKQDYKSTSTRQFDESRQGLKSVLNSEFEQIGDRIQEDSENSKI